MRETKFGCEELEFGTDYEIHLASGGVLSTPPPLAGELFCRFRTPVAALAVPGAKETRLSCR